MLFTNDYSIKMPVGEALATSLIGVVTVIFILAAIGGMIILVSKAIRAIEDNFSEEDSQNQNPATVPVPTGSVQREIELIDTDEKTAAVIMSIVSEKSGIPLNRLSFKSIKLIRDEKRGDETE